MCTRPRLSWNYTILPSVGTRWPWLLDTEKQSYFIDWHHSRGSATLLFALSVHPSVMSTLAVMVASQLERISSLVHFCLHRLESLLSLGSSGLCSWMDDSTLHSRAFRRRLERTSGDEKWTKTKWRSGANFGSRIKTQCHSGGATEQKAKWKSNCQSDTRNWEGKHGQSWMGLKMFPKPIQKHLRSFCHFR